MLADNYDHTLVGIYATLQAAEQTIIQLQSQGLNAEQTHLFGSGQHTEDPIHLSSQSDKILKEVVVDTAVGAAVGAGAFGLGQLALMSANLTLFAVSPVLGTLAMLGWGASVGGILGGMVGAAVPPNPEDTDKKLVDLVGDAINSGYFVVVTQTTSAQQTELATTLMRDSVKDPDNDVTSLEGPHAQI